MRVRQLRRTNVAIIFENELVDPTTNLIALFNGATKSFMGRVEVGKNSRCRPIELGVYLLHYTGKLIPHCVTMYSRMRGQFVRVAPTGKLMPMITALPVMPSAILV